jgi:hypothetical protein
VITEETSIGTKIFEIIFIPISTAMGIAILGKLEVEGD